jgi:hypothetical protein
LYTWLLLLIVLNLQVPLCQDCMKIVSTGNVVFQNVTKFKYTRDDRNKPKLCS